MEITIAEYTKEKIADCIAFEVALRKEENFWGWEINDNYKTSVLNSFSEDLYKNAISFLAYVDKKVVGRIDACLVSSHFDGSIKAYLDWICVIKSYRHNGIAQKLMQHLCDYLRTKGIKTLIGIIASNKEAQSFYRSLPNSKIKDEAIWIEL